MKSRRPRRPVKYQRRSVTLRTKVKQERRQHAAKFGLYLLLLGLVVTGGWFLWKTATGFLFHSDYFRVKTIAIRGTKNVAQSEIAALLPFRPGDNLFQLWISETEQNIAQCKPELKNISVRRGWQKVTVRLEERTPVACVTIDGQRRGLDDDNLPFPLRGGFIQAPLPEILSIQENDRREVLSFIRLFAPQAKELYGRITRFSIEPVNDIVFELDDGARVFWGPADRATLKPKLERLAQVMQDAKDRYRALEYVNLHYFDDGRIIVKPKGAETTLTQANKPDTITP